MIAIFRIFFVMTLLAIPFIMFLGFILRTSPKEESLDDDLIDDLADEVSDLEDELIPMDVHEMKILSWQPTPAKRSSKYVRGYLSTIFQEKLIAYARHSNGTTQCLYTTTSEGSYAFLSRGADTKVFLSGKHWGTIHDGKVLRIVDGQVVCSLSYDTAFRGVILKNGEEIVSFYKGDKEILTDRFFTMINQLDEADNEHILILSLYVLLFKFVKK